MVGIVLATAFGVLACGIEGKCKEFEALLPSKEQIEKVRKDFERLEKRKANIDVDKLLPSEGEIKRVRERYKHLGKFDQEKTQKLIDALLTSAGQQRIWEMFFNRPMPQKAQEPARVIFYLFSRSVPSTTVGNVFRQAKKIKGYEFYGVVRGIDKKLLSYLTSLKEFQGITVKINPLIFEKVGAEVVPAFVFAECKKTMGILRTKDCDFKAVLYGDVSLKWAIERYEGTLR